MSELQNAYTAFARNVSAGYYSDPDPRLCGCHGSGWFTSDFDTWHGTWCGAPWAGTSLRCCQTAEEISRDLDSELDAADIPF